MAIKFQTTKYCCLACLLFIILATYLLVMVYYGYLLKSGLYGHICSVVCVAISILFSYILHKVYASRKNVLFMASLIGCAVLVGLTLSFSACKLSQVYYWHKALPKNFLYSAPSERPLIALTFDDGPEAERTGALLDVLKKHNAHASFFLVGEKVLNNEEIIRRMIKEGHSVGNHSWSHRRFRELSEDELKQELEKTNAVIESVIGHPIHLLRPPGGDISIFQKNFILSHFNFTICMWNRSTGDCSYGGESPKGPIIQNATSELSNGSIILAHDWAMTPETLDALLTEIENKGCELVSIQELADSLKP